MPSYVRLLHHTLGHEVFGYLHGVEGCAFLDLVTYNPEGESVVVGEVLADAAYVYGVFAGKEEGHGVFLLGWVVHEHETIASSKGFAGFLHADGALGLEPDALGV